MRRVLDLFCMASGQKTRVYFSQNVDSRVRGQICSESSFQATNDLGKYLGVPVLHNRVSRSSFQFILDKIDQRLSGWKAKMLSFAGRLTLTKSVLQSLPSYTMQAAYIPRSLCDAIDQRCRNFLWGDSNEEKHVHLVNWKRVCCPKEWGGLGLRTARAMNQTALMKAGWHLIKRREDLWVRTVKAKYRCGTDLMPKINSEMQGSNFWRGVCHAWPDSEKTIGWHIGGGNCVNVWRDLWMPDVGKLERLALRPLSLAEKHLRVADLRTGEGTWNLSRLRGCCPVRLSKKFCNFQGPEGTGGGTGLRGWRLRMGSSRTNQPMSHSLTMI